MKVHLIAMMLVVNKVEDGVFEVKETTAHHFVEDESACELQPFSLGSINTPIGLCQMVVSAHECEGFFR